VAWDQRPDRRTRRALLHLSYSSAPPFGPVMLVTQDPSQTFGLIKNSSDYRRRARREAVGHHALTATRQSGVCVADGVGKIVATAAIKWVGRSCWPSSLCSRLVRGRPAQMNGEEGAHFRFRILRRRLVIFESIAPGARTGQNAKVEVVMGAGIDDQVDRRTALVR